MNKIIFAVAISLAASVGVASEMHVPTFLPAARLQQIQAALDGSVPSLWSEAQLESEGEKKALVVYLRLASSLGAKDFSTVCKAAARALASSVEPSIPTTVFIIREKRVMHEC